MASYTLRYQAGSREDDTPSLQKSLGGMKRSFSWSSGGRLFLQKHRSRGRAFSTLFLGRFPINSMYNEANRHIKPRQDKFELHFGVQGSGPCPKAQLFSERLLCSLAV